MKKAPFYIALLPVLALAACIKTIPVELDAYEERIAIESLLLPGTTPTVYLNKTVPFFAPDQTPSDLFIRGAEVVITSSEGADFLKADSIYNWFWCRYEPFYAGEVEIKQNETYTLTVTVNGKTYTATTVTDVQAVTIDSVSYTDNFVDIYGGHEGVIVDFMDIPGQPNQYRFQMDRPLDARHETVDDFEYSSTCMDEGQTFLINEIGRFVYFDTNFDGAPVRFVAEPAYINFKGDPGVVYVQSLNRDVAEYFDVLDRQRESNINPFIEPVFLDSKIEGAIGVFGAINRSEGVDFVFPADSG